MATAFASNSSATLLPSVGHLLLAETTASAPNAAAVDLFVSAGTLPTGFTNVGHTDLDQVLVFGQEGGDTTVKGSWQASSLREITTPVVEYFVVKSLQMIDTQILKLYYGGGTAGSGKFDTPDSVGTTELSALLIMVDSSNGNIGLYVPKCSIRREGEIEFASDDFTKLPLRFTTLKKDATPKSTWLHTGFTA